MNIGVRSFSIVLVILVLGCVVPGVIDITVTRSIIAESAISTTPK